MNVRESGEAKTVYLFASRLIPSDPDRMPDFERRGHMAGEDFYYSAYHYTSSHDLVEEFCAAGVRPLKHGFGIGNDQLAMVNFEVEGIDGPFCCLKFNLDQKRSKAKSFVRDIEYRVALYCGRYSQDEHKLVLSCMATSGRFNRILSFVEIPYSPRKVPRGGDDEALAGLATADKKRKCGSDCGDGSTRSRPRKGLLPLSIDSGSSPSLPPPRRLLRGQSRGVPLLWGHDRC